MIWTIYCALHLATGRRYIGQTRLTLARRWWEHCWQSRRRGHHRQRFLNALAMYGPAAFVVAVLERCPDQTAANEAECAWIASFSTLNERFGFNIQAGGSGDRPTTDPLSAEGRKRSAGKGRPKKPDATSCKHGHPWPQNRVRATAKTPGGVAFRCRACCMGRWRKSYKPNPRPMRTHCRFGHEFTPENTRSRASSPGAKICKECERAKHRRQVALKGGPSAPL